MCVFTFGWRYVLLNQKRVRNGYKRILVQYYMCTASALPQNTVDAGIFNCFALFLAELIEFDANRIMLI